MPQKLHPLLIKLFIIIRKRYYLFAWKGITYFCPFCGNSFRKFLPAGLNLKILKEKNIIGGGFRLNATCPFCSSIDRDKLVYLFLKSRNLLKKDMTLLHIAPERKLQEILLKKI